jgi:predicted amino acid dehydrogenase
MVAIDPRRVFKKVVDACRVAESHRIGIAALGGFTSIVGERFGDELRKTVSIPLTTGNTFTVALALQGVRRAAELMGKDLKRCTVCVIGGTGDIGGACARILAEEVKCVTVTGRNAEKVKRAVEEVRAVGGAEVRGTTQNADAVTDADIVIAAASVTNSILDEGLFKTGAVICDLAYPKNISYAPSRRRDILVFSGGLAAIPDEIDLGFEIGLPSARTLYGCFSEAVLLDLDKRYESFSHGHGNITRRSVEEIEGIASKHGFALAPFYWGYQPVPEDEIRKIGLQAASENR